LNWISESAVSNLLSNLRQLKVFELRMWPDIEASESRTCNVVTSLVPENLPFLTDITIVGVSMSQKTTLAWSHFKNLQHIEVSDIGTEASSGDGFLRQWLTDIGSLEAVRITKCGIQWEQVADLVRMRDSEGDELDDRTECPIDELVGSMEYEDEVVIIRSRGGWEWRWS
jgi:hypothetical protein